MSGPSITTNIIHTNVNIIRSGIIIFARPCESRWYEIVPKLDFRVLSHVELLAMPICPLCLYENAPEATACEHCGRYRFSVLKVTDEPNPEADTVHGKQWKESLPPRFGTPPQGQPAFCEPSHVSTVPLTPLDDGPLTQHAPQEALSTSLPVPPPLRLVVVRGQQLNAEFPLYDGPNYLGRSAERPADIDLSGLEPAEQVWSSRQHAVIHRDKDLLSIEDLNSLNGTFLNRQRLHPGKRFQLKAHDVIQIGTVQLRVAI
ncbi:FHA domain-containing protein [soil metagenome]